MAVFKLHGAIMAPPRSHVSGQLPTPRSTLGHANLCAICRCCQHSALVDLAALIASGRGDVPLIELRLRCGACGGREVDIRVEGRQPWE